MIRAIVVDGRYKGLELGSVHEIERLSTTSLELKGISRIYHPSMCSYVDDNNAKITAKKAIDLLKGEKWKLDGNQARFQKSS